MLLAALQLDIVWHEPTTNRRRMAALLDAASLPPGSVAVLPELGDVGFTIDLDAVTPSDAPDWATEQARVRGIHLAVGYPRRADDGFGRNEAVVAHPDGQRSPPYAKVHPFGVGRETEAYRASVAAIHPGVAIVRPSLIWGLDPLDHQTKWLVDGVKSGSAVSLFTDEIRCPVFVNDLADWLIELAARRDLTGPFNAVGTQALSRWEFGQKLMRKLGLRPGPNVKAALSKDLGLNRARNLTLEARRAGAQLRVRLRGVDEVLTAL